MLARCPNCHTVFRIAADQLKAGRGLVRCGICLTLFDALDNLRDENEIPIVRRGNSVPVEPAPSAPEPPADFESGEAGPSIQAAVENIGQPTLPKLAVSQREESIQDLPPAVVPVRAAPKPAVDEIPPRDDLPLARRSPRGHPEAYLWGAGAIVLMLGFMGQVLWFRGNELLSRFPALRVPLDQACSVLPCALPVQRDLTALRLLSRDVRAHPRYQDALLVNATFVNEASFPQPYPVLQLGLFGTNGAMLAARRFQPTEYLDDSIDPQESMKPGLPVHIVVEIVAPKQAPMSFEFKFL